MAELRVRRSSKRKMGGGGGIVKLKIVFEKIQKSLLLGRKNKSRLYCDEFEEEGYCDSISVPEDVKEGHFAVIADAENGQEPKRFVVPLSILNNPSFLRLLEQAAEEYGFDQDGALTIPCRPSELEMLLAQQWQQEGESESETAGLSWNYCNEAMVKSY